MTGGSQSIQHFWLTNITCMQNQVRTIRASTASGRSSPCVSETANLHLGFWFKWVLIALADYLMMAESGVESRESGNYLWHGKPERARKSSPKNSSAIKGDGALAIDEFSRVYVFVPALLLKGGIE